jgi:hypothetical protein
MTRTPATRLRSPRDAGDPAGYRDRRPPAAGGAAGSEDPLPPDVSVEQCHLLAMLRAWVRVRMQSGESLAKIGRATGLPLGSLRKWTYRATTGDAVALEDAIARLGGGSIEIPAAKNLP